ncbi:MAG TPA: hypothetical protein VFY18_10200, partial [Candidatus Limnocylindrales bacterium]|nr:hypothetical protein [Candidatus Limnocylindrales bacterium]
MTRDAADESAGRPAVEPSAEWPITVVASWTDPGYDGTRVPFGLGFAAVWTWVVLAPIVVGAPIEPRLLLIPLIMGIVFGGQWLLRR